MKYDYTLQYCKKNQKFRIIKVLEFKFIEPVTEYIFSTKQEANEFLKGHYAEIKEKHER